MPRHHCIFGFLGLVIGPACAIEPAGHTVFGESGGEDSSSAAATTSGEAEAGSAANESTAPAGSSDDGEGNGPAGSSGEAGSTSEGVDASAGSEGETSGGVDTGGAASDESTSGAGSGPEGGQVGDEPQTGGVCSGGGLPSAFTEAQVAPELHIFGVYQGQAGQVTVTIDRTGIPLIVVLSSYEPVMWELELAPGVLVDEVILNGYEEQSVMGQGAAIVTDKSGIGAYLSACAYAWPGDNGGCDTEMLVSGAEVQTGAELASFTGCYEGVSFSLL